MKTKLVLLALVLFSVLLAAVYLIHVYYFNVDVVFYSAIVDGVIAAVLTLATILLVPSFRILSKLEKAQAGVIFLLLGYAFAISVPTVIDRSLSFYLLEKLQQRGGSIPYQDFDSVFKDEYMKEHHLVDIRLTEQVASGTIVITDHVVHLTERGSFIAQASRYFRQNFLPKHRLLMGSYTDVLTDPFRDSENTKTTR